MPIAECRLGEEEDSSASNDGLSAVTPAPLRRSLRGFRAFRSYSLLVLFCISLPASSFAQDEDFAAWLAKDQAELAAYNEAVTRQYEAYVVAQQKAFEEFVKRAGEKWGKGNVWVPEQKVWVQYTNQFEERSSVDFENGKVRVQLLFPAGTKVTPAVRAKMTDAVRDVLLSGTDDPVDAVQREHRTASKKTSLIVTNEGTETFVHIVQPGETAESIAARFGIDVESLRQTNRLKPDTALVEGRQLVMHRRVTAAPKPAPPIPAPPRPAPAAVRPAAAAAVKKPLLTDQVVTPDNKPVTAQNVPETAAALVEARPPVVSSVKGEDGSSRAAVTVEFPLVPDHLRVRAERFKPFVAACAKRHSVDPALVFAIMHTESCFNPRARSGAPAFGLMQLVPTSGARDAYRYVFKKDTLVNSDYLYDPERNIELGTAYLYLLDSQQLRAVRDPLSRQYCAIAAYNTGAGNVSRAFGGTRSVATAAREINALRHDQVYAQLRSNLPYQETRDYVKRVSERVPLYAAWR